MKNVSAFFFFLVMLAGYVATADSGDQNELSARSTQLTRRMALRTPLNEGQYMKVRQLNMRLLAEVPAAQAQFSGDAAALDKQLAEVQARYEWDLATILWPRQMQAYTQAKADLMAFGNR
ncbi:hypothetical protein [Hymenobacter psychrotolerans]|uniref:Heavy-metal resistance n=1 Tax=Hymenobacter psychrotolerans DSM 18569 TaxID=1121959 RepID=A0A1M6SLN6_9BACT|nr:hypothetical protein [Hymenobacter psychrotolerans]SHK45615.1 hypothetical protein SAMN02746009_00912 [Hymenobacter psychrotolerans DSM 18569]